MVSIEFSINENSEIYWDIQFMRNKNGVIREVRFVHYKSCIRLDMGDIISPREWIQFPNGTCIVHCWWWMRKEEGIETGISIDKNTLVKWGHLIKTNLEFSIVLNLHIKKNKASFFVMRTRINIKFMKAQIFLI